MAARRNAVIFWGSAALFAAAFAAVTPLLIPYETLRLFTPEDRRSAWLLIVFCAGVLAVLFGVSGLVGTFGYLSVRDVLEAPSVMEAMRQRREARGEPRPYTRNFGAWIVAAGVFLIGAYFVLWLWLE